MAGNADSRQLKNIYYLLIYCYEKMQKNTFFNNVLIIYYIIILYILYFYKCAKVCKNIRSR